jgi:hypothetical protein
LTPSNKKDREAPLQQLFWENLHPPEKKPPLSPPKRRPHRLKPIIHEKDADPNRYDPESIYRQAWKEITGRVPHSIKEIEVVYYPYKSIQAKAVVDDGRLRVRISKMLEGMPLEVFTALSRIMVGRLEKKPYPRHYNRIFDDYTERPEIQEKLRAVKRQRIIRVYGTRGKRFDLEELFEKVNKEYFQGKLPKPILSWTKTPSRKRLGYAGEHPDRIFISRVLDKPGVPRYVAEFIMYHEMLHLVCPLEKRGRQTIHHTKEFRRRETFFKHYAKARKWMGYDPD